MAESNFREYLKTDLVKSKKYFYVLRPVLACLWIEKNLTPPSIEFDVLLNDCEEIN
jgi:predicted nucleotidyltransferase